MCVSVNVDTVPESVRWDGACGEWKCGTGCRETGKGGEEGERGRQTGRDRKIKGSNWSVPPMRMCGRGEWES